MTIKDPVFGELQYDYGWSKDTTIDFMGKETDITLMIDGEEDGNFDAAQYEAYQTFMRNWKDVQLNILKPIIEYYNQKRHELGFDIDNDESFPTIQSQLQLLDHITLVGIVVPYADIHEGRDIGILFDCNWDKENGLGIRLLNDKVTEIGYQDVAI
ncbi:DUF6985 domain-containing protein [Metabacillus idriensis]|uniref:DUF6985 domain-containing protein n=1 Tax=Metabacillus idriensis TaxID=324768 RepID=UPI0017485B2D|nr:DUF2004 domain-containing protein [Metabacillus idriensis]